MRKSKFVFYLLLLCFAVRSQNTFDWFPFHPNGQYNYKISSSTNPIDAVIKIDSVAGPGPFFHLNKIVRDCDTCHNASLVNDFYDSTYILANQPQFAGSFFKQLSQGFYFKGLQRFFLDPFKPQGSSWIFDTVAAINASLVSRNVQLVLGNSDSTCLIRLSSNDTILLSKSFGLIRFPLQYGTPDFYTLAGLEGPVKSGTRLLRFHDFFDWQAGDVFQYSFSDEDFNSLPPLLKYGHERWDILTSAIYSDSVCYTIRKTYLDSLKLGGGPATITAFTKTLNLTFIDSLKHPANLYPSEKLRVDPYFLYYNGMNYIHKIQLSLDAHGLQTKSFGENCPNSYLANSSSGAALETPFTDVYLNKNSAKIIGRKLTEGLGFSSELYNDYSRIYQRCLIGYIRHNDTTGIVYTSDLLSLEEPFLQAQSFELYPLPANTSVIVSGPLKKGMLLNVFNSLGELLHKEQLSSNTGSYLFDTSSLPDGIYFIKVGDEHSSILKKAIIAH